MRALERNKQTIYYANRTATEEVIDEYGNYTGEYNVSYGEPEIFKINISAARGEYSNRQFGEDTQYDKILLTNELNIPITESSILWIDNLDTEGSHDYIVKKIAKSLNSVSIAVSKVNVSLREVVVIPQIEGDEENEED